MSPSTPDSPPTSCLSALLDFVFGGGPSQQHLATSSDSNSSNFSTDKKTAAPTMTSSSYPTNEKEEAVVPLTKTSRILIVGGGGTMGSSAALHLARRGYTDVTILDQFPIPSAQSAGFDLNKIAGGGGDTSLRGELMQEIMKRWRTDPVFSPYYHEVGRVTGAHSSPEKIAALRERYDRSQREGWGVGYEWLDDEEAIVTRIPQLKGGDLKNWKGLWVPDSGWVAAKDTIASVGRELERLGVKMHFGPSGTFSKPILSASGKTCTGVVCADDTRYEADRVIMACGAWTPALIDLKGQCVSKCWVLAHLQLTPEEYEKWKGVPVLYHGDLGFFIEPRAETHIMKLCNEFPGYTRILPDQKPFGASSPAPLSVPRSHAVHPTDSMPEEGLNDIKRLIKTLLPEFEGRELIDPKMCWCTDTADAEWLFCEDPRWKGLYLATGDSGHSFHTIPYVGSEIADMLEGKLSKEKRKAWGWRPGHGDPDGTGREGPPPKDLDEVPGWNHGDEGQV